MHFEDTGLPWVIPSPNMPTVDTAFVYPGGCLIEGTNLSEGRGTTRPFELVGAPWLDPWALARDLERERLPGALFRPVFFTPTFHKHAGLLCGGRAGARRRPGPLPRVPDLPAAHPSRAAAGRRSASPGATLPTSTSTSSGPSTSCAGRTGCAGRSRRAARPGSSPSAGGRKPPRSDAGGASTCCTEPRDSC